MTTEQAEVEKKRYSVRRTKLQKVEKIPGFKRFMRVWVSYGDFKIPGIVDGRDDMRDERDRPVFFINEKGEREVVYDVFVVIAGIATTRSLPTSRLTPVGPNEEFSLDVIQNVKSGNKFVLNDSLL